jgi:hypothetical protein
MKEDEDGRDDDRMDEKFDATQPELEINLEDPPTSEVQKFFDILRALKQSLYEHTTVSVIAFVTHLMAIKSKFAFSNNCYKKVFNLASDVLPNNHKMLKNMYQ